MIHPKVGDVLEVRECRSSGDYKYHSTIASDQEAEQAARLIEESPSHFYRIRPTEESSMSSEVKGVYLGDSSGQRVGSITREYKDENGNDRLDIQIDKEAYEYIQQCLNHQIRSTTEWKTKEQSTPAEDEQRYLMNHGGTVPITIQGHPVVRPDEVVNALKHGYPLPPVTLLGDQVPTVDWDRPAKSTPLADIQKAVKDSELHTRPIEQSLETITEEDLEGIATNTNNYFDKNKEGLLLALKEELLEAHRERGESFIHLYPLVESAIHRERYSKFQKLVEAQSFEATVQTAMQAWNEALIELEKAGDILAKEPKLKKFTYTAEDGIEMEMDHWAIRHLMASVQDSLGEAKNYNTIAFELRNGTGGFLVTIQRMNKETPGEQLFRSRSLLETIVKLCNDGKRVSFSEDTGGNTLTVSINARHSHVGTHECTTQELLDQLHGLLVEGRGLSWHDETEEYKDSGQMALALKNRILSGDEITDEMRRQIVIMLICYEGLICQQFLPENRDNEPTPENPT